MTTQPKTPQDIIRKDTIEVCLNILEDVYYNVTLTDDERAKMINEVRKALPTLL